MSRSSWSLLLAVGVAVFLPGPSLNSQAPQFRASTTTVPVDVYVVDQRGNAVVGLTQDDFTVSEDGVSQRVLQFIPQTLRPDAVQSSPSLMRASGPASVLFPQNRRIFLLVLGRGRLQEPSKGLDGLLYFVRERLLPQDVVAVMAWNRATEFTTDHQIVAELLERFKASHQSIESRLNASSSGLAGVYGSRNVAASIQAEIDAVFGRALGSQQPVPGATVNTSAVQADLRRTVEGIERKDAEALRDTDKSLIEAPLMTDLPFEDYVRHDVQTMHDLEKVYSGINYLRLAEGQKHLVLVTEHGLFLPRLEEETSLAAAANDARVAIHTIQAGGVSPVGMRSGIDATGTSLDVLSGSHAYGERQLAIEQVEKGFSHLFVANDLRTISRLTGGQSSISEYTRKAVERVDVTSRASYLIGYNASNPKQDGSYRRIDVKVNRKGVTVLFRHGYYARQAVAPPDRQAFIVYTRIASAAGTVTDIHDIRLLASGSVTKSKNSPTVEATVEVRIDLSALALSEAEGKRSGTLQAAVFFVDANGQSVGERWQTINLNLGTAAFEQLRQQGVPYVAHVPVKTSARYAKVVVYDPNADRVGTAQIKLR